MCAICTPRKCAPRCEFAPPNLHYLQRWSKFASGCKFAPGCIFIKHRLHDQNTSQVQIYTPGVYIYTRVYIVHINKPLGFFLHLKMIIFCWHTEVLRLEFYKGSIFCHFLTFTHYVLLLLFQTNHDSQVVILSQCSLAACQWFNQELMFTHVSDWPSQVKVTLLDQGWNRISRSLCKV